MNKNRSGFTIVELLIVIVVIGILAAITIVAYNGIQTRASDADRVSDMQTMKKALEMYYIDHSYYPTSNQMRSEEFRSSQLQLSNSNVTPQGSSSTVGYCWPTRIEQYCYVAYGPGPADCTGNNIGEKCTGYTLSYWLASDPGNTIRLESSTR